MAEHETNIDDAILEAMKYLDDAPCPEEDRLIWDEVKGEFVEV